MTGEVDQTDGAIREHRSGADRLAAGAAASTAHDRFKQLLPLGPMGPVATAWTHGSPRRGRTYRQTHTTPAEARPQRPPRTHPLRRPRRAHRAIARPSLQPTRLPRAEDLRHPDTRLERRRQRERHGRLLARCPSLPCFPKLLTACAVADVRHDLETVQCDGLRAQVAPAVAALVHPIQCRFHVGKDHPGRGDEPDVDLDLRSGRLSAHVVGSWLGGRCDLPQLRLAEQALLMQRFTRRGEVLGAQDRTLGGADLVVHFLMPPYNRAPSWLHSRTRVHVPPCQRRQRLRQWGRRMLHGSTLVAQAAGAHRPQHPIRSGLGHVDGAGNGCRPLPVLDPDSAPGADPPAITPVKSAASNCP